MTERDKNQLLEQVLGGEELDQVRQATLVRGLREMRGRRRRSLLTRVAVIIAPILFLAWKFLPLTPRPAEQTVATKPIAYAPKTESKIEYITAEQLFALFPNRPLALVGKPGHQQVIFLDEHPVASSQ